MKQRLVAILFLIIIFTFFLWEKQNLQNRAHDSKPMLDVDKQHHNDISSLFQYIQKQSVRRKQKEVGGGGDRSSPSSSSSVFKEMLHQFPTLKKLRKKPSSQQSKKADDEETEGNAEEGRQSVRDVQNGADDNVVKFNPHQKRIVQPWDGVSSHTADGVQKSKKEFSPKEDEDEEKAEEEEDGNKEKKKLKLLSSSSSSSVVVLDIQAAANMSLLAAKVCPLPVLHPHKFEKKMGWGIRKQFPSCRSSGKEDREKKEKAEEDNELSEVEEQWDEKWQEWIGILHVKKCADAKVFNNAEVEEAEGRGRPLAKKQAPLQAWSFKELQDSHFIRLSSTVDAETRQNELKQYFSLENIHEFATSVALHKNKHGGEGGVPEASSAFNSLAIRDPYVLVKCGKKLELHVREVPMESQFPSGGKHGSHKKQKKEKSHVRVVNPVGDSDKRRRIQNFLHIMVDSSSLYALRRSAKQTTQWLEKINNNGRNSEVFSLKHYHAVSCCSPGNQIPVYSGNLNGEGDPFVNAEPYSSSRDWIWNIAKELGFTTFWSLDNCPDKSARDYHAYPSVDSRIVAPLCLAGVLLSHKDMTCLAGQTVDAHVLNGLKSFWKHHEKESKFAAVQFITPHEESEKLLMEVDRLLSKYFLELEKSGVLENTAILYWSDHGVNFGKYASTHDGEIEKMFPFANFILPKWFTKLKPPTQAKGTKNREEEAGVEEADFKSFSQILRGNAEGKLTTPYDVYEATRTILYYPDLPSPYHHDIHNPPLPKPSQSHIMASFQKEITPQNLLTQEIQSKRNCWEANIPMEFCTCIAWEEIASSSGGHHHHHKNTHHKRNSEEASEGGGEIDNAIASFSYKKFVDLALKEHQELLAFHLDKCQPIYLDEVIRVEKQTWPVEYHPKAQKHSKPIWMKPNRDMLRITYQARFSEKKKVVIGGGHEEESNQESSSSAIFQAVFSLEKKDPMSVYDLASLNRLDAMKKKCGLVEKQVEHLCVCK